MQPRFIYATNVADIDPNSPTNLGLRQHETFNFPNGLDLYMGPSGTPPTVYTTLQPSSTAGYYDKTHYTSVIDLRPTENRNCATVGQVTTCEKWQLETTGMAVQQTGDYLVVLHGKEIRYTENGAPFSAENDRDIVALINKNTGAYANPSNPDTLLSAFGLTAPRAVAIHGNVVYIVCRTLPAEGEVGGRWIVYPFQILNQGLVSHIVPKSGHEGGRWWTDSYVDPLAVAVSPDGQTVVVADGGTRQQLVARDPLGNPLGTNVYGQGVFGQLGGYRGKPNVMDDKFDFGGTYPNIENYVSGSFLAFQTDGTLWVVDSGTCRMLRYQIGSGFMLSKLDTVAYKPRNYDAGIIKGEPNRLMLAHLEYEISYAIDGNSNSSWALKRNWHYFRSVPPTDPNAATSWGEIPAIYLTGLFERTGNASTINGRTYFLAFDGTPVTPSTQDGRRRFLLMELMIDENGVGGIQLVRSPDGSQTPIELLTESGEAPPVLNEFPDSINGNFIYSVTSAAPSQPPVFSAQGLTRRFYLRQFELGSTWKGFQTLSFATAPSQFPGEKIAEIPLATGSVPSMPEPATQTIRSDPTQRHVWALDKLIFYSKELRTGAHLGAIQCGLRQPPGQGTVQGEFLWKAFQTYPIPNVNPLALRQCWFFLPPGEDFRERVTQTVEASGEHIIAQYHGERVLIGTKPTLGANQFMHFHSSGLPLGQFGAFAQDFQNGNSHPLPGRAVNAFSISFARPTVSGEERLYFFHGDEGIHSAVHRWRIKNHQSISFLSGSGSVSGTIVANN